jgi:putative PIN family toxin of toxin-antitoxin system
MEKRRIVLDTNVVVSALRSRRGAAFRVLSLVGMGDFEVCVSVPLVLEYEDALHRATELSAPEIETVLAYLCSVAIQHQIYFLWRPTLADGKDDMVLELAVASRAECIVTFNRKDFAAARRFGVKVVTPQEFLISLGAL